MATIKEQVQQLYIAYFNRPGDAAGVEYYVDLLEDGVSIDVLRADFVGSKEYTDTYAGKSTEAVVNQIYTNLFGHSADIPGLKYYAGLIDAKTVGYDILPWLIANGAQTTDITAFANKATAAAAFTDAIAADANLRVAYANGGEAAINTARGYLSGVTDTAGSLASALAGVATTVQGVIPVTTSALTAGLDNFIGGVGNDVINAFAANPATGQAADTLTSVDSIDGGAGRDTLNIEITKANNTNVFGTDGAFVATIKNVEVVNVNNVGADAGVNIDASTLGSSLTEVWQIGKAGDVTGLAATTTAGFRNINSEINVAAAAAATTAKIALENFVEGNDINVKGDALAGVTVTGSVKDSTGADGDENTTVDEINLNVVAAKDVQTVTVNTAVNAFLTVSNTGKAVTTVDASASTGSVLFNVNYNDDGEIVVNEVAALNANVTTIKGGSGDDALAIATDTKAAATGVTAVSASVTAGAGDDTILVATKGNGTTTIDAGDGDDTVHIASRGTGALTVNLGAGNDTFTSDVAITAKDKIDAGAGVDTLLLSLVGSANIGAFSNFDVFDAKGLEGALDVEILSAKNTVTEFVASDVVGADAELTNVGANVGFRATGDMGESTLTITQKTAGALTVTVDADETGSANDAAELVNASVATNATSVKAVFDTSYQADTTAEAALAADADNVTTLNLTTSAATTVTVQSGGALSSNVLNITDASEKGTLTSIVITGDRAISVVGTDTVKLGSVDSSAATGGLTFNLDGLKDTGFVKLGSGADVITVTSNSTLGGVEQIQSFEKAVAAAVGSDAAAAAAAIADADQLVLEGASIAGKLDVTGGALNDKGVLTFTGAGVKTIDAAVAIANLAADGANEALVFEYQNNSYVFVQGGDADTLVQLTGITGVTNFAETGTDHFFLV